VTLVLEQVGGCCYHSFGMCTAAGARCATCDNASIRTKAEGHRPHLHQQVTLHAHVGDLVLEPARGGQGPELAGGVDQNGYTAGAGRTVDPGHEGGCLHVANPDRIRFGGDSLVPDVDVAAACREVYTRPHADCDVGIAAREIVERVSTEGGVG